MVTLIPAYGRDYKSASAVLADWVADKDFLVSDMSSAYDGRYINRAQVEPEKEFRIRYNHLRRVCVVKACSR